jgi:hypothetical protein
VPLRELADLLLVAERAPARWFVAAILVPAISYFYQDALLVFLPREEAVDIRIR